ncbi:hypothetical protein SCA6_016364 [Theobroma cacao]
MVEVKLDGFWASPFSHGVIWALKLKEINYEYVEEDLPNKSELLLKYNPVYKKKPVLVHDGKPIAESLVILEYIEETWPQNPLLPQDVYERAIARFWIKFGEEMGPTVVSLFQTTGEEREKARKQLVQKLKILEEHALGDKKFSGGEAINLVDIEFGVLAHWVEGMEEVMGLQLLKPGTLPQLRQWIKNFKEVAVIKENLPDKAKLLAHMKVVRELFVFNVSG